MAYFSCGAEGMDYEDEYCRHCIHGDGEGAGQCPIWMLHLLNNYDECNKDDSYLHVLIPRSKDGLSNERCTMFRGGEGTEATK